MLLYQQAHWFLPTCTQCRCVSTLPVARSTTAAPSLWRRAWTTEAWGDAARNGLGGGEGSDGDEEDEENDGDDNTGGTVAGVLVALVLIGLAVGGFVYYRKRSEGLRSIRSRLTNGSDTYVVNEAYSATGGDTADNKGVAGGDTADNGVLYKRVGLGGAGSGGSVTKSDPAAKAKRKPKKKKTGRSKPMDFANPLATTANTAVTPAEVPAVSSKRRPPKPNRSAADACLAASLNAKTPDDTAVLASTDATAGTVGVPAAQHEAPAVAQRSEGHGQAPQALALTNSGVDAETAAGSVADFRKPVQHDDAGAIYGKLLRWPDPCAAGANHAVLRTACTRRLVDRVCSIVWQHWYGVDSF